GWWGGGGPPGVGADARRGARRLACRAVTPACGPPAGPVHLTLAFREPLAPEVVAADFPPSIMCDLAAGGRPRAPWIRLHGAPLEPDASAVTEVAALLAGARHPLIVCGPLDDPDPTLADAVAALARAVRSPVLAQPASHLRR